MKSPLHILHLEDDASDAELIQTTLRTEDIACEIERVETRKDFTAKLTQGGFDIILSDLAMPTFDGVSALEFAQKQCRDVPFIFVSGSVGEELAIDSLKSARTTFSKTAGGAVHRGAKNGGGDWPARRRRGA
jgi:CheY-like chemotaxis protein